MTEQTDEIYYQSADSGLASKILMSARRSMFRTFMAKCAPLPYETILDIGVSGVDREAANVLEKLYPYPKQITCAGLGDGKTFTSRHPNIAFQSIEPTGPLPFEDRSFDIVCSNAVIEHVGGSQQRVAFILEAMRVARRMVFITAPNRWFPVEHHTGIPILHYIPTAFRMALKGTSRDYWSDPKNMDFISGSLLKSEWPKGANPHLVFTGIWLGPFSSNIAIFSRAE